MKMMNFCTDVCLRACMAAERQRAWMRGCRETVCGDTCVRGCMYTWMRACMRAFVRAWMYVCVDACVDACVCIGGRPSWIFPRGRFTEAPVAYRDTVSAPSI